MIDQLAHDNTDGEARKDAGFSLLEILISITILGLLATIVVINVLPAQDQAMVQKARTDIATLEQALDAYRMDMREYPSSEAGLVALTTAPRDAGARYREGGYIRRLPDDPWGNPYQYIYPGRNGMLDIFSLGRDGREGGEGLDADIGNWQG
jgi:general secretion pathway protein G